MRITNLTKDKIICTMDEKSFILEHNSSIDVKNTKTIKIMHINSSYSSPDDGNSKLLKFLSALDDPFQLRKEFHIHIDYELVNCQIYDSQQIVVTANSIYVDSETRTYYEYFVVTCDDSTLAPTCIHVAGDNEIKMEFEINDRKLSYWNAVWNILIEPLLLETMCHIIAFFVLRAVFGQYVWAIILPLIALNVLIELIVFSFKARKRRVCTFLHYLDEAIIRKVCYSM